MSLMMDTRRIRSCPRALWQLFLPSLVFLSGLAGCANPGPPRAPSLHLPKVVADLDAQRVGDQVTLRWTTSDKTTDGITMTGAMTAQVCRALAAATCVPVLNIPVKAGATEVVDPLPAALVAEPQGLLTYTVSILNSRQRSAGPSLPAFAAAGSAPPAVAGLRAEPVEQGAMLQWEPKDEADMIELDRLHSAKAVTTTRPAGGRLQPTAKEPTEMRFRAAKASTSGGLFKADAGGSIDATARRGETYSYTAQRVRAIKLNGHPLEIRSDLSPVVTVVMRDNFPPHPPTGLEAILAAGAGKSPAIDLSWRPNTEPDLAGYLVYRQETGSDGGAVGARAKITATPVAEPGFHDATVASGHAYRYSVTAVDGSGNEGSPSAAATQDVP